MKADDAIAMLGLDDAMVGRSGALDAVGAGTAGGEAEKSDYAIALDQWGQRRGRELLADPLAREAAGLPPIQPGETRGPLDRLTDAEGEWAKHLADFHGAAFEPNPEMNEACKDQMRHDFVRQMMETPDFHDMRQNTQLNAVASEIAATCFAKQYAVRVAEAKRDRAQGKGGPGSTSQQGADGEILTMRAAAEAVAKASQQVQEFTDACNMAGLGAGSDGAKLDPKRLAALYKKVRTSPNLQKIAKLAGRFRRLAQSKQRQKSIHGVDEVVGVTLGDEIAKLVPAELMKLAEEDGGLDLDTLRRLTERECQVRETRAQETVGKGPIVVVVDESGSMSGDRIETAKALALALAWVARHQKRWCLLASFSSQAELTPDAMCLLHPKRPNEEGLLTWLQHFYGGGTHLHVPLGVIPSKWADFERAGMMRGKTDMIIITDDEMSLDPALRDSYLAFKKAEKVRLTTLSLAGRCETLKAVSDEVHLIQKIDTEGDAVNNLLSL